MGYSYGAICNECGTTFEVNEGSGMSAMPFHCNRCGKEWWWEFGVRAVRWERRRSHRPASAEASSMSKPRPDVPTAAQQTSVKTLTAVKCSTTSC